jgi:hypothetical protein
VDALLLQPGVCDLCSCHGELSAVKQVQLNSSQITAENVSHACSHRTLQESACMAS